MKAQEIKEIADAYIPPTFDQIFDSTYASVEIIIKGIAELGKYQAVIENLIHWNCGLFESQESTISILGTEYALTPLGVAISRRLKEDGYSVKIYLKQVTRPYMKVEWK